VSEPEGSRILIDATMTRNGGGFTYLVNLLPPLATLAPHHHFHLLLRSRALRDSLPARENLESELLPEAGLAARLRFTHLEAPRRARATRAVLYFGAGEFVPLRAPCPTIASFRNPNVFTTLDQGWYPYQLFRLGALRQLCRGVARTCARVVFVSRDSASWIGDAVSLPEQRRVVIHHGVDARRFASPARRRVHPRPYLLSVSSIYRYKNFVRLIEAWAALARRREGVPDLVIVGDDMDPDYSGRMEAARRATGALAERIRFAGEVPYAEIPDWYAGAALFALPSYLETFGHPLLEAMASGVPVVCADIPVSREIASDAALYCDPHDPGSLERALETGLYSREAREALIERGHKRAEAFRWEDSARAHLELFDLVIRERGAAG
jgi:glycosyltransferase involved in cell wall biosynthesis